MLGLLLSFALSNTAFAQDYGFDYPEVDEECKPFVIVVTEAEKEAFRFLFIDPQSRHGFLWDDWRYGPYRHDVEEGEEIDEDDEDEKREEERWEEEERREREEIEELEQKIYEEFGIDLFHYEDIWLFGLYLRLDPDYRDFHQIERPKSDGLHPPKESIDQPSGCLDLGTIQDILRTKEKEKYDDAELDDGEYVQ